MCGVAGFHLKNPNYVRNPKAMEVMVDELLHEIEWRGKHATGLAAVTNAASGLKLVLQKEPIPAKDFLKIRRRLPKGTRTVLLHTRHATQGSVNDSVNNHPVMYQSCLAVHNGGIDNDAELFKKYKLDRAAEVDSEAVPAMLHHFGWDKVSDALETLAGGFAIAAVDPVKEPGKVILAKGLRSPLFVIENENFIIWASSRFAIRQAWGKVLGTPPKDKVFLEFRPGQGIMLDGMKSTPFQFDAWKADRNYKGTSVHYGAWGVGETSYDDNKSRQRTTTQTTTPVPRPALPPAPAAQRQPRGVVCNRLMEVAKLRREDEGAARRFELRDCGKPAYDQENMVEADGRIHWVFCPSCRGNVCAKDMMELRGEGMVCLDCIIVDAKKEVGLDPKPFRLKTQLTKERESELDSTARATAAVHEKAIEKVVKITGLERWVIDYLMFHAAESMFTNGSYSDLTALCAELTELYDEQAMKAWEDYDWDEHNNHKQYESCETKTNTGLCRKHGHPVMADDRCYKCYDTELDTAATEAATRDEDKPEKVVNLFINGEEQEVARCAACGRFRKVKEPCEYCAEKNKAAIQVCSKCIRKATVFLNDGKLARYCSMCYNTCHLCHLEVLDGTRTPEEMGKPNTTLASKVRVCHFHARNKKGAIPDARIPDMGMEVRSTAAYSPTDTHPVTPHHTFGPTLH